MPVNTVPNNCVELLSEMGLTALEAEIYVYLLQYSPASGYKIAKGIGRSFPSTYKAVAALQTKGAVLVDDGKSRLSRAVPVDELMSHLERRFRQRQAAAVGRRHPRRAAEDDQAAPGGGRALR